jgi:hypothetical protein
LPALHKSHDNASPSQAFTNFQASVSSVNASLKLCRYQFLQIVIWLLAHQTRSQKRRAIPAAENLA